MKATKTPAGSWNVRVPIEAVDGKRKWKSITAPTKKEAEMAAALFAAQHSGKDMSIRDSVYDLTLKYIEAKRPVLSPSTIRSYITIAEKQIRPYKIGGTQASMVTQAIVQSWIGTLSKKHSPKTVRNAFGLLSAVYALYLPHTDFRVTLPRKYAPAIRTPEIDEIKAVLDVFQLRGDMYMIRAILLASCCSLRRGEICALMASDVDFASGIAFINKSMVLDGDHYSVKAPKTETSNRMVPVPGHILELLPREGKVVDLTPAAVTDRWRRAILASGVPEFRFHDLRHYWATVMAYCADRGISRNVVKQIGGWSSSSSTMERIYIGTLESEKRKQMESVAGVFGDLFSVV